MPAVLDASAPAAYPPRVLSLEAVALLVAAGLVAGVVNTLAGGGSLLTLPALIFVGLPAGVANGTNRVAVLVQSATASAGFRRGGALDLKRATLLLLPSLAGAAVGAALAVRVPDDAMQRVIAVSLLVFLVPVLVKPDVWLHGRPGAFSGRPPVWMYPALFAVGVYGGFLQAGVGFLILAVLVLGGGLDLVRANGVKVYLVAGYTVLALAIFLASGQVEWRSGIALAAGNGVGGWLGARMALRRGAGFVRAVLVVAVLASAAKLLGLLP